MSPLSLRFTLLRSVAVPKNIFSAKDLEALGAFVLKAEKVTGDVALTLELTGHKHIQELNRHYRGVDRTTDVISFRNDIPTSLRRASGGDLPAMEGDIAINVVQTAIQAKKVGNPVKRELRLLWIHGILHLMGYTDYEPLPRRKMFKRQNELLRRWEGSVERRAK